MRKLFVFALGLGVGFAQSPAPVTAKPAAFPKKENLRYSLNWSSGLSFGDAQLTADTAENGWGFSLQLQAALPKFPVAEFTQAIATNELCTLESVKKAVRGPRKTDEKTVFEPRLLKATRETVNGGKSEISVSPCARDGLTFLYYLRRELVAGRLPQSQTVYYGAGYQVTVRFTGTVKVKTGDTMSDADRVKIAVNGPKSAFELEADFLRDAVRTPAAARIAVASGTLSMELAP